MALGAAGSAWSAACVKGIRIGSLASPMPYVAIRRRLLHPKEYCPTQTPDRRVPGDMLSLSWARCQNTQVRVTRGGKSHGVSVHRAVKYALLYRLEAVDEAPEIAADHSLAKQADKVQ